ncbi:MAG: Cof-type HAD-IIB family hydrolase [Treponema sp.]|nr:Cof-type HAD-IIB family hydrolase [Treponema sp.]
MKLPTQKLDVKLTAFDLDDTLLSDDLSIHPDNKVALQRCAEQGIYTVLCSGRADDAMLPYIRTLNIAGTQYGRYFVSMNGASVFDLHKRIQIYGRTVSSSVLQKAYALARERGLSAEVYDGSSIIASDKNEWTSIDAKLTGLTLQIPEVFEKILEKEFPKMIIPGEPQLLLTLQDEFKKEFGSRAVIFISKPYFLEVMPPACGKGEALLWLANELGIDRNQTMAFGDSMNDESMLRGVYHSVAMTNGLDYLKQISRYETRKDNNHAGVADFLNAFVLA